MPKTRLGFARASSLRAAPIFQLLLAASFAVGVGATGHMHHHKAAHDQMIAAAILVPAPAAAAVPAAPSVLQQTIQNVAKDVAQAAPLQMLADARASVAAAITPALEPKPENVIREAELDDGQSFAELLSGSGVGEIDAAAAMNALGKVFDLRRLQAGQNVTLSFLRTPRQESFTGAVFQPEATREVSVARNADGSFSASTKLIPVVRRHVAAQGEIRSSLYEAGDAASVPHAIMAALIRIYSHDIDFQRDIHPGDKFEVLYDQPMTAQGKAVGEGDIIYAALTVGGKVKPVYRVTFNDNTVDYFDDKGQSVRRALLRTPVAAARITSGFGMRMHPLLGYTKMHKGVDFGAPTGAPIFAAGNGVIEDIGWRNGYGRYIRIRHNGTLATAYAHMSRFAANMYRGARVNQGEVIGYVGMTGRATGPHLHYEVHVNGQAVNPMSVNLPTGRTLDGKLLADFRKGQGKIQQEFAGLLAKKAIAMPKLPAGVIQTSSAVVAFPIKTTTSCGLRSGC